MRVLVFLLLLATPAHAVTAFDASSRGLAMDGYDPVSYFIAAAPQQGAPEFAADWAGVTWHFASPENRDRFLKAPDSYAPQFGGWCAWAVGHGYLQPARPTSYAIVRGKLYLNWSPGVQRRWEASMPANIASGHHRWPDLERGLLDDDG